jgi:hypothetical protein
MQNNVHRQLTNSTFAGLTGLLLGVTLAACDLLQPTAQPSETPDQVVVDQVWEESGQASLTVNQGDSPLNLAHVGFEAWLSQYTQANTPLDARLEDFNVDLVEAVSDPFFAGEYDFVFRIEYSVRPAPTGLGRWLAGDGRQGESGWVVGKLHYVGVRVVDDRATFFILGPCPMC